jgi:CheY-specific phosphatase CheX
MNNEIIENIIKMTKQLFATMFQVEVVAGMPYIVDPASDTQWDISGVISIAGSLSGLLAVRYHQKLTYSMLENSRIQTADLGGSLLGDMVGEVSNTIAGNVLSNIGLEELYLSIPVAIQGGSHIISWPRNTEITAVPFYVMSETFVVQIGLK